MVRCDGAPRRALLGIVCRGAPVSYLGTKAGGWVYPAGGTGAGRCLLSGLGEGIFFGWDGWMDG